MKEKDEIFVCKTCDRIVSEAHPLFSQRIKNPDHDVVNYLPSSSVKELVEAASSAQDLLELNGYSAGPHNPTMKKLETALQPFKEEK